MSATQDRSHSLLLVDGMAVLFRAYYATAYSGYVKRTRAGLPVNAIQGFLRYFADAFQRFGPTHVACCWDLGGGTFRGEQFAGYKGNRPEAPDDLIPQFELIKEVTACFGIPNISAPGFEADDCIGTLARQFSEHADVTILTGDHDLLQLVDDRIRVAIMKKGQGNYAVYTPAFLMEERQLTPAQVIDLKGLMGDTSDNYPGVRGIGEKTALKLIREYASIDGILENLHLLPASLRTKIETDLEMLHLSRQLATISCEAPVAMDFSECLWNVDRAIALAKCEELELRDQLKWIG
ncbi:5'-3' exonuclease H3TH domain-containing protein [Cohnella sp. REN36]|uniref:5'-3' exonuclease n=1 Tax=Cohnella sp. REN36 TaxID=2887347 RepID=UPI001D15D07F|nr:5'-3' exonuclease H3TH domain-containing protein [Cohnella sp. REN36]MCC3377097.1 5'-3' exonuclease [Cohnella sp. REN36]